MTRVHRRMQKLNKNIWCLYSNIRLFLILACLNFFNFALGNVIDVSGDQLSNLVKENQYVLVAIVSSECRNCDQFLGLLEAVDNQPDLYDAAIIKAKCSDSSVIAKYGISDVPKFLYFRHAVPALFEKPSGKKDVTVEDVNSFVEEAQRPLMKALTDETFEHLTQAATGATTGDWFVIFYSEACSSSLPVLEAAGVRLQHKMSVAKINIETNPGLVNRFKVTNCPTYFFFRQGKMYPYTIESNAQPVQSMVAFATSWYKNVVGKPVPIDPSQFDILTENIANYIKDFVQGDNHGSKLVLIGVVLGIVSLVLAVVVMTCTKTKEKDKED